MFRLVAIVLATTLCLPAAEAAKPDIRTVALEIPTGAPVRIKTTSKQTIQGKLTNVTSEGVTLQVVEKGQIKDCTVPFSDMKSIQQANKSVSAGMAVLATLGVIWLLSAVVMVAATAIGGA